MIVHGGGTIRLCAPSDVRLLKRGNVAEVSQRTVRCFGLNSEYFHPRISLYMSNDRIILHKTAIITSAIHR